MGDIGEPRRRFEVLPAEPLPQPAETPHELPPPPVPAPSAPSVPDDPDDPTR